MDEFHILNHMNYIGPRTITACQITYFYIFFFLKILLKLLKIVIYKKIKIIKKIKI
jgi:hypothetical protein